MIRSPAETRDRWLNYGRRYARYPTLWDSSLAFASGPLAPEAGTLRDYSGRTAGATWSVGAGDVPKYTQGSVRGGSFWAGYYDGTDDTAVITPFTVGSSFTVSAWRYSSNGYDANTKDGLITIESEADSAHYLALHKRDDNANPDFDNAVGVTWDEGPTKNNGYRYAGKSLAYWPESWTHYILQIYAATKVVAMFVSGNPVAITFTNDGAAPSAIPTGSVVLRTAKYSPSTFSAISLAGVAVHDRTLTPNEIATLATHPLAAYAVDVPRYWSFAPSTHLWPWQIRRSRRVRGHR